jgi:DNA-binding NarL/FixJ family response regulator
MPALTQEDCAIKPQARRKVLLVDDHEVVRTGLATLINGETDLLACGEADNEMGAFEAVEQLQPDVAVVDWSLKSGSAAELVTTLRQDHPRTQVLVLSVHDEVFYAEQALQAGARGYVMKTEAADTLLKAIRHVAAGHVYLSERASQGLPRETLDRLVQDDPGEFLDRRLASGSPESSSKRWGDDAPESHERSMRISIVIPVFNSEASIGRLCETLISKVGLSHHLQIVLVDDGSSDNSAGVCRHLHERHPGTIDFISLSRNFGEHNAVMAGLHHADGDYCIIMDDDFQNPPSEVRKLIDEVSKGYDAVFARYENKRHSGVRNIGSRLHNWLSIYTLGKPPDIYLSSFKALSRFMVQEVIRYPGPSPYLDAIILTTTRRIGQLKVRHDPRSNGRSGYSFARLVTMWANLLVTFSPMPARLLGMLGFVAAWVGVVAGCYHAAAGHNFLSGPMGAGAELSAGTWIWRGLVLMGLALVAEYVGRSYRQLNRQPQFVIREILRRKSPG